MLPDVVLDGEAEEDSIPDDDAGTVPEDERVTEAEDESGADPLKFSGQMDVTSGYNVSE